jgi:hypothetical protein
VLKRALAAIAAITLITHGLLASPAQASNDWSRVTAAKAGKGYANLIKAARDNRASTKRMSLQYFYEGAGQGGITATGSQANFQIPNPVPSLDTGAGDFHTLAQIATMKTVNSSLQAVEVGWTVDQALNGDTNPHLFVHSWVNGTPKGYNAAAGSGWNDYAPNATNAGATLTSGDIWQFRTQYNATGTVGWWVWAGKWNGSAYVGDWLGHYAATHWTGASPTVTTFTGNTDVQYFWEVAANSAAPCTDMGNSNHGSISPLQNYIASTTNIGGPASVNVSFASPVYADYSHALGATTRTMSGGGPGSC